MMARLYDMGKHGNECYQPIPVHTPNSRRVPVSKPYVSNVNSSSEATAPPPNAPPPRYDSEYDYKTTHYPSYPPNYPYDDHKYKYEGSGGGGGGSGGGSGGSGSGSGGQQQAYNAYNEKSSYAAYEDTTGYDSRGYTHANTANLTYPTSDAEYGSRYYSEGRAAAYPADNCSDQYDKGRYSNYGYDQRCYYDQSDGRYAIAATDYRYDMRYPDARHPDGRHMPADPSREPDSRYVDSREMDRRYIADGREHVDSRYVMDNREFDGRYAATSDSREPVDSRYADPARYSAKENYYDRYYKHRPTRDHHVADASRY